MIQIEIEKNDAFRVLQAITRDAIVDLEGHIISRMKHHGLMDGDVDDCGNSLDDIALFNGITMDQLIGLIFTSVKHTDEIPELAKSIVFIATGSDHPCPQCGCELIIEPDGDWTNVECSNCNFRDTTEPDWDIRPGGHSFDN